MEITALATPGPSPQPPVQAFVNLFQMCFPFQIKSERNSSTGSAGRLLRAGALLIPVSSVSPNLRCHLLGFFTMSPATDRAGLEASAVMVEPGFESATVWALFS